MNIEEDKFDVLVVGAGAAGIGIGVALKHAGITNFQILDRNTVGHSFVRWPPGMRLITPSFPANSIGMLDLNSVAIGTSPGYSLSIEHPTGRAYAAYLQSVANFFELPTRSNTDVYSVEKVDEWFELDTAERPLRCKHLIWATGEFQFPNRGSIEGSELGKHNAEIHDWKEYVGSDKQPVIIIGGYESAFDAAYHLAGVNRKSVILSRENTWDNDDSDPSRALSPYTLERAQQIRDAGMMELHANAEVISIVRGKRGFEVNSADGRSWKCSRPPILATGFRGGFTQIKDLFEFREDGFPLLNEVDESTSTNNLFLVGPGVRHENLIFCFIFKYRQRFGVVAKEIGQRLNLDISELEETYRRWGMFLDDLSCCGEQCVC